MRRIALVALLALLTGCGSSSTSSSADKYTQTWTTGYDVTTCAQMLNEMTTNERRVAAADLLAAARSANGVAPALPSDAMVDRFKASLEKACASDLKVMTHPTVVTQVAVGVYLLNADTFGAAG